MRKYFTWLLLMAFCLFPNVASADYYGSWKIDDVLTITANTHLASTGAEQDASAIKYFVYEDNTDTAILSGSMSALDDANTTGFYAIQLTLSAANGFEKGKTYTTRLRATVGSISGQISHNFQVEAEVDSNNISSTVSLTDGSITSDTYDKASVYGQTGDSYARLGAPAGASIAADIAENQTDLDAILDDTGTSGVILASTTITTLFKEDISGSWPNNSVAKYIRTISEAQGSVLGTATAGTSSTITLEAGSSTIDGFYVNRFILITAGTGVGQVRTIHGYVGSTLVATVEPDWDTTPDATSAYNIMGYAYVHAEVQDIADNVIASDDFDKSSAFPITSADSGSTQIARVGADGDTLEALSDQLDIVDSNIDTLTTGVNIASIYGSTTAAEMLSWSADKIYSGRAQTGTLSTTQFTSNLAGAPNDNTFIGRIIFWTKDSSLAGEFTRVTAYDKTTGLFTVVQMTAAPINNDKFVMP